jgi:hypothetical protein
VLRADVGEGNQLAGGTCVVGWRARKETSRQRRVGAAVGKSIATQDC